MEGFYHEHFQNDPNLNFERNITPVIQAFPAETEVERFLT
jgi:hypothetical protein